MSTTSTVTANVNIADAIVIDAAINTMAVTASVHIVVNTTADAVTNDIDAVEKRDRRRR